MIIDLHFHTEKFSSCSTIPLLDGLEKAKKIGLDGICLTEHDVFHKRGDLSSLAKKFGLIILIGTEIYTTEGDILCYGLDKIPRGPIAALELVSHVKKIGGSSIAAHPFRKNNRGIKDLFTTLPGLTAVEAYNGNTTAGNNILALEQARSCNIAVTGASDAHSLERIGFYATEFRNTIESLTDLNRALQHGDCCPVRYTGVPGTFERLL